MSALVLGRNSAPVRSHGGNRHALAARCGRGAEQILDFSANINPLGMPDVVAAAWTDALSTLRYYPDPECSALRAAIGAHLDVDPAWVLPGNGAEQLIWWLPRLVGAARVVVTSPCYLDYRRAAAVWGLSVAEVLLAAEDGFRLRPERLSAAVTPGDLVWIGRPNNPTGCITEPNDIIALAEANRGVWWAVDEAFIDFVDGGRSLARTRLPNLIVLRSMTKFYALPGLRLGYAVLPEAVAAAGSNLLPDWSVSAPAQHLGVAVLQDSGRERFVADTLRLVARERAALASALRGLGITVVDGAANYQLARLAEHGPDAVELADGLLQHHGIAVRTCTDYLGLDARYVRLAVRLPAENARLLAALSGLLDRPGG